MHRKIKERERQQWKEDTKKKILLQQQQLYREVLREHKTETGFTSVTESTISSESSTYKDDSSCKLVTVKIRCFPKDDENNDAEKENNDNNNHPPRQTKKTSFTKTHTSWAEEFRQNSLRYDTSYNTTPSSSSVDESQRKFEQSNNHSVGASTDSTKYISLEKPRAKTEHRLKQSNLAPLKSPPRRKPSATRCTVENGTENLKEQRVVDAPSNPPPSRSSASSSRPKSCKRKPRTLFFESCFFLFNAFFLSVIRPWRLQPESHRSCTNTKSDPVALYQKYRDQWKQLALPGEENHAGVRWAVREKMLGNDPNPRVSGDEFFFSFLTIDGFFPFYVISCDFQQGDFLTHRDIGIERSIAEFRERGVPRRNSRKVGKFERIKKPVFLTVVEKIAIILTKFLNRFP